MIGDRFMKYITTVILLFFSCSLLYSELTIDDLPKKYKNLQMITSNNIKTEVARNFFNKYNPQLIASADLDNDKIIEYVAAFRDPQDESKKWHIVIMHKDGNHYKYITDFEFFINNIKYCIMKNNSIPYVYIAEAGSGAIWNIVYIDNKYIVKDVGY